MIDLMDKQVAKMDQCRMLVLDEADKLLSQDFKGMLDMVISRYVFRLQSYAHFNGKKAPTWWWFFGFPFIFYKW